MLPAKLTHGHVATFPRTEPPRSFVSDVFSVFQKHSIEIETIELAKGLSSDAVIPHSPDNALSSGVTCAIQI
jgi:hypothetical protein